jgi:hypothetical protein
MADLFVYTDADHLPRYQKEQRHFGVITAAQPRYASRPTEDEAKADAEAAMRLWTWNWGGDSVSAKSRSMRTT